MGRGTIRNWSNLNFSLVKMGLTSYQSEGKYAGWPDRAHQCCRKEILGNT